MTVPRGGLAEPWRVFSWHPAVGDAAPVKIFHVELGDPGAPVLLFVHGWPTSSIDWFDVAGPLSAGFRVCALDFPGYGFSGKPRGWGYSLIRDAELTGFYLSQVLGAEAATVVAHDRGDSVALVHAARCAEGRTATRLEHLVLTNGNIFLPLSNLTQAQRHMLDPRWWPQIAAVVTPPALAATTFTPPRQAGDPQIQALTAAFAHDDGTKVLHETIRYLAERAEDEHRWLTVLASAPFPVTVIWGLRDTVSPPRVASYVRNQYLAATACTSSRTPITTCRPTGPAPSRTCSATRSDPQAATDPAPSDRSREPLLVDTSRDQLPAAAGLLRTEERRRHLSVPAAVTARNQASLSCSRLPPGSGSGCRAVIPGFRTSRSARTGLRAFNRRGRDAYVALLCADAFCCIMVRVWAVNGGRQT